MDWGKLLLSFDGRVGRATFWYYVLALIVLFVVLTFVFGIHMVNINPDGTPAPMGAGGAILGLVFLVTLWPTLAIYAKRWHDVDKSAWWILIGLVPAIGGIIALVFNGFIAGTPGPNRFGPPPA